uniref:nicotinamidase n=1 Tax=Crithidia acanthocephali TaxID=59798 RepID=T1YS18_9TRYP|nr:nicotinamidase [Crithidia acanthocephali]
MASPPTTCAPLSDATDGFIIVDMQNDFLVEGAPLHVPGGAALLEAINATSRTCAFRHQVATQDWHPPQHCSFAPQGGPWPAHCVRGSPGAELHPLLDTRYLHSIVRKGTSQESDSYSAFADENKVTTGLAGLLHGRGVTRVFVCGVAYDYCVFFTAMDAKASGFDVVVVSDLCAAVDRDLAQTRTATLAEAGIAVLESSAFSSA